MGGAGGRLVENIKNELEKRGKITETTVIEINNEFVKEAEKRGLKTVVANVANSIPVREADLAIMRNVLHYNSIEDIKKILANIKESLKPEGYFINQVISGKDENHVQFINEILSADVLGRGVNYLTNEEYLKLCNEIKLPTEFAGYAPTG